MESIRNATAITIAESTHVAAARRAVADLCRRLALSDSATSRAELITVELAGNILAHAREGHLYIGPTALESGLQIIASDLGPGLGDLEQAMADGYSTSTTPGLGLGAVSRQADQFDVYSRTGEGAVVTALILDKPQDKPQDKPPPATASAAVLSTQLAGEMVNGDAWAIYPLPTRIVYLLVDGLGHGSYAHTAACLAVEIADRAFESDPGTPLAALLQRMHPPMQATRGAAVMLVSVAHADAPTPAKVLCCGVGNISAVLASPDNSIRSLVSHNGTVGHRMARVQEFEYPAAANTLLVMHSDGISTRWKLSQYPNLIHHPPATIAGVLYRDSVRLRDDATILVAQLTSPGDNIVG